MTPVLSVELELFAAMYAAIFFVARHMDMLMGFSVLLILVLVHAEVTFVPNASVLVHMAI